LQVDLIPTLQGKSAFKEAVNSSKQKVINICRFSLLSLSPALLSTLFLSIFSFAPFLLHLGGF
jgi:hypothetical protein